MIDCNDIIELRRELTGKIVPAIEEQPSVNGGFLHSIQLDENSDALLKESS